ncbi:MAG: hypothetical protein WCO68_00505 [Verrucomicrobiota bacterium]
MKHPNIRIARLKEMIALEEKRASLLSHIEAVNERLSIIQSELYGAGSSRNSVAKKLGDAARSAFVKRKPTGMRKGRGELRGQILEMLNAAGKAGVSVKELADRIGVKTANIHSWFSINAKKIAELKKIGEARYAINGVVAPFPKPAKKSKAAKKGKAAKVPKKAKAVKVAKSVKVMKAPKAAKAGKKAKVARSGRGELKAQILDALKTAGAAGITIKDLAAKLNANYKNVYIWFVTTGKKIAGIKKVGPARYKLEA